MTGIALPGSVAPPKARAIIEKHTITPEGLEWLRENGYGDGKKQTREVLDLLVDLGMARLTYREQTHNLILNNGLTYIRDSVRLAQGAVGVPATVVNGMVLGSTATAAAGTQNGILGLIVGSFNTFQTDPPAAGGAANQIDWVGFWGANDPVSGPHSVEEVAIVAAEGSATTSGICRITSGLSLTKQDADTLTITITWTIGTIAT